MKSYLYFFRFLVFLAVIVSSLNAQNIGETVIFFSNNPAQWVVDGRITYVPTDSSLKFLFDFDDSYKPKARPDTTILDIISEFDLSPYDSVYFNFTTQDYLPTDESWVAGTVLLFVKHEGQNTWTEVYGDLTGYVGHVRNLKLRMKIAVRSSAEYPGAFAIDNIKLIGTNR